jgi:hypothetical protein
MRWVAIGLSIARAPEEPVEQTADCRALDPGRSAVDKGRLPNLMVQPVEIPEPCDASYAAMSKRLAATARFVCLSFGLEDPLRTAGNEGVPLQ